MATIEVFGVEVDPAQMLENATWAASGLGAGFAVGGPLGAAVGTAIGASVPYIEDYFEDPASTPQGLESSIDVWATTAAEVAGEAARVQGLSEDEVQAAQQLAVEFIYQFSGSLIDVRPDLWGGLQSSIGSVIEKVGGSFKTMLQKILASTAQYEGQRPSLSQLDVQGAPNALTIDPEWRPKPTPPPPKPPESNTGMVIGVAVVAIVLIYLYMQSQKKGRRR